MLRAHARWPSGAHDARQGAQTHSRGGPSPQPRCARRSRAHATCGADVSAPSRVAAVIALAQLTALQATYKAASRRHGVSPLKPMLQLIEDSIQEQASINKVGGWSGVQPC
eukprot:363049-Chlamydomonas_euryale.AAC.32